MRDSIEDAQTRVVAEERAVDAEPYDTRSRNDGHLPVVVGAARRAIRVFASVGVRAINGRRRLMHERRQRSRRVGEDALDEHREAQASQIAERSTAGTQLASTLQLDDRQLGWSSRSHLHSYPARLLTAIEA